MSHSSKFKIDGVDFTVLHNGDWSGEAQIWKTDGEDRAIGDQPVAVLPGRLLVAISRRAVIHEMVSALEEML